MTKKDYIAIASVLNTHRDPIEDCLTNRVIDNVAADLAVIFKADNSNFRPETFAEAVKTSKGLGKS